jgi:hypothetical protein
MDALEQAKVDRELEALISETLNDTSILTLTEQSTNLRDSMRQMAAKKSQAAINARLALGTPDAKDFVKALTDAERALRELRRDLAKLEARTKAEAPKEPESSFPDRKGDQTKAISDTINGIRSE